MAIYKNFTGDTPGTDPDLITKNGDISGLVSKINITCTHPTNSLVVDRLYLDDGTNEFDIIYKVKVPIGATLVLEDNLSFNVKKYSLKIKTSNSSNCSIIIK